MYTTYLTCGLREHTVDEDITTSSEFLCEENVKDFTVPLPNVFGDIVLLCYAIMPHSIIIAPPVDSGKLIVYRRAQYFCHKMNVQLNFSFLIRLIYLCIYVERI